MYKILVLPLLTAVALCAQSPDLVGVWKADLQKSKLAGPPPTQYLAIIEKKMAVYNQRTKEQAPEFVETTGEWGQHGQERSVLTVFENGKPSIRLYRGIPTRLIASSQGNTLAVHGEIAGRPSTFERIYTLSPDGKTLTLRITNNNDGKQSISTIVLAKEPDSAGEPLRKPEESAQTHFKNVKTTALKDLPASEFIDHMHYFAWALNRNCEFCHVAHKFDSDDKKEKRTARKMIDMVASIDQNNFKGHPAVRCFTCHEGHAHPLSHPQFPDEAEAEKAAIAKEAARHAPPAGPQPPASHPQ